MFILFQAYSEFAHTGSCPQLRVIFSFYASTIVPALEAAETVTDQIIAKILPNVQLVSNEARDWLQNYKICFAQFSILVPPGIAVSLLIHTRGKPKSTVKC